MRERTRYRISGSLFLAALAVIFLPMLFDGAGAPQIQVPTRPATPQTQADVAAYDEVVPVTDVVERVTALAAEVDADGFSRDTSTRFGEPVLNPAGAATQVWAVQAASFAEFENAQKFRSRLRDAGLEAFISTSRDAAVTMHRVAVGPLLEHDDAERILTSIQADFDVKPQIVEMVP